MKPDHYSNLLPPLDPSDDVQVDHATLDEAALSDDEAIFARAGQRRVELELGYAGAVTPPEAWALARRGAAQLIDVRTAPEFKFVGRVPDSPNVEWHGSDPQAAAAFARGLHAVARADKPLLLICRSGVRSHAAAAVATAAGFGRSYNVLEGFEGQIDVGQQRGRINGWRWHGLPWVQD
jgi:rhodanese-related sulfurtransferase